MLFFLFCIAVRLHAQSTGQLEQELKNAKARNDANAEAASTMELASAYEAKGNYELALGYYKAGLALFEKFDQPENTANAWAAIAKAEMKAGNYAKALDANKTATDWFLGHGHKKNAAYTIMCMGDAYWKLKQTAPAIAQYTKALQLYKMHDDPKSEVLVLNKIGAIYSEYGNPVEALAYLNKAYGLAVKSKMNPEAAVILKNMEVVRENSSRIQKLQPGYVKEQAAAAAQKLEKLEDQQSKSLEEIGLLSEDLQVKELKVKVQQELLLRKQIEMEKQQQENELLRKKNELEGTRAREEIYRQKLIIVAVSVFSLLCLVLIIILYNYYKQKKRANGLLQEKNEEIIAKGEQIKQQAVEIARYQSQMNPHFIFNAINGFQNEVMEGNKEKILMQIQSFAKLLRQTLTNSENEYISVSDEIAYLTNYVEFELHRFSRKFVFTVEIEAGIDKHLQIPTMLIQPLIENAIKHADLNRREGGEIKVSLRRHSPWQGQLLSVTVTDNGLGIRETASFSKAENTSKGIAITKYRIRLALQKHAIDMPECFVMKSPVFPDPYKGTTVTIYVPYVC